MLTAHENLLRVISGGEPEWLPACVHITNDNNLPQSLPETLLRGPRDYLAISEFVGGDLLHEASGVRGKLGAGFTMRETREGDSRITTISTPLGELEQHVLVAQATPSDGGPLDPGFALPPPVATSNQTAYFVKTPTDYAMLAAYADAQAFAADPATVARESARVGDRGLCLVGGGPPSPLYALVSGYTGIERLVYDLADEPEKVEHAMASLQAAACRWYEAAAATPCEAIRCTEDLDTKLVSPELFRRYAAPALKQYADICHAAGKRFVIHMCGHVNDLLPEIRAIGADAIHCLTTPPTGNTTIAAARQALSPATAAMIRVDPHLLLRGSDEALDAWTTDLCRAVGDWRNALLIIPCGRAPLRNVRRVIERVKNNGSWNATAQAPGFRVSGFRKIDDSEPRSIRGTDRPDAQARPIPDLNSSLNPEP